jgi:transcriptional regulator with XRE-family HTH domain
MIFSPIQCRMARAAVGLGVRQLAAAAKVSVDTVARFERGEELKERTIDALRQALEAAGVEFTNGDQPGVRISRRGIMREEKSTGVSKSAPMAKKIGRRRTKKRISTRSRQR